MPNLREDVMFDRPVAFDVSRLVTRLPHPTPTGIDRVDLAYARWLLDGSTQRFAVLSSPVGPRVLGRRAVTALLAEIDRRWSDTGEAEADPTFRSVAQRLGQNIAAATRAPGAKRRTPPFQMKGALFAGSRGVGVLPKGTVYLHSSHLRLDRPERFTWLRMRPDIRGVFFVHDLIPIEHPEFSRPGEDARHRTRLATIARHGRAVIVNSVEVKRALLAHWTRTGGPILPVSVAPLGVEAPFRGARGASGADAGGGAFFLVCGTIEPRKNHALLFHVWRRLAEGGGPVPKLVVAGRRGWECEGVVDFLERAPFVRDHVIEATGLSTPALARIMGQARGLLMPSFAEGYGLPVAEALSLGTPVVASDIPVHREVAGDHATLVDPLDGPGWLAAVRALAAGPRRASRIGVKAYRPPNWEDHIAIAAEALVSVG